MPNEMIFSPLSQTHKILFAKPRAQAMLAIHSTSFQYDLYTECTSLCLHWGCTRWSRSMLLTHFDAVKYHRQALWTKQWAQSNWESLWWVDCLRALFYCEFRTFPAASQHIQPKGVKPKMRWA